MAEDYLTSHYNPKQTHPSQPIPGREKDMKKNRAGGSVFKTDKWTQLDRFLVLGSEGSTYYASEKEMTIENAQNVMACIKEDGSRVVNRVVEMSDNGRIPKNDTALFVHAMTSVHGDEKARDLAYRTLHKIARIGTHLFHWANYRNTFGGWGSGARKAVQHWYLDKPLDQLAYQMIKYRQRDGWSHLDLLRLAHVKPTSDEYSNMFAYAKTKAKGDKLDGNILASLPAQVQASERIAKSGIGTGEAISLIREHRLPFEVLPKDMLNDPEIWKILLENMPMTAMIRNLGKMTAIGVLKPMSNEANKVIKELTSKNRILKARVHPIQILSALITYEQGHGFRGKLAWKTNQDILDALNKAFYLSFGNVVPTNKRILIGLDVSSSMSWGNIVGVPGLSPARGAAALSLITKAAEDTCHIMGFSDTFKDLGITSNMRLDQVMQKTSRMNFGSTDCSLPMVWAHENKVDVDAFIIITDNETWYGSHTQHNMFGRGYGNGHPAQALAKYRKDTGIPAKLIVVAMTATDVSIADPKDPGMLDVVGFDQSAPNIISDFIRGDIA